MSEPRSPSVFREYLEALVVAAIFLGFTNTFVLKTFYIPSGSMKETLLIGDHLFVNRFVFGPQQTALERAVFPGRPVQRGDIVIFRSPETPELDLVKRCVGLPGDTIEVIDKDLFVNGSLVDDDHYTQHVDPRVYARNGPWGQDVKRRDNFGPLAVPEQHIFCMGDNRDSSYDSRYFGTVPLAHVKGRAVMVYWSYGGETPDGTWRGWGPRMRQLFNTVVGFVPKTRWERTFKIVR
ncbi:MAG TPA: signal peptidase I [Thermoanaerobaculia bacterium]|nr:signal peptidase I [Thermoanaerobaculia bacterium]